MSNDERAAFEAHAQNHGWDTTTRADGRWNDLTIWGAWIGWKHRAAIAQQPAKRCEWCDDTGDVVSITGEWRGRCICPEGAAIAQPAEPASEPFGPGPFHVEVRTNACADVCDSDGRVLASCAWHLGAKQRAEAICAFLNSAQSAQADAQPAEPADAPKRWPFVESPGEFASRLEDALAALGELLPAVRHVLIEDPPTLAVQADAQPVAPRFPSFSIVWTICRFALRQSDPGVLEAASHQVERLMDVVRDHYEKGQYDQLAKLWLHAREEIKQGRRPMTRLVPSDAAAPPARQLEADAQPVAPDYGSTDFGFSFAGIELAEGDKRLLSLLTVAFGNDHPAFDDLVALVFAARGSAAAPPARLPLTHMQIVKLWGHRSDGPSTSEITSFARAIERAHGIGREGE